MNSQVIGSAIGDFLQGLNKNFQLIIVPSEVDCSSVLGRLAKRTHCESKMPQYFSGNYIKFEWTESMFTGQDSFLIPDEFENGKYLLGRIAIQPDKHSN